MIIAHQGQHAAITRGARKIGMAENIARTIHPRTFAIPDRKYAIKAALAAHFGLLRPPNGRRRQILIKARRKHDMRFFKRSLGALQLVIEPAQRRAPIARDKARRVQPSCRIARLLHE